MMFRRFYRTFLCFRKSANTQKQQEQQQKNYYFLILIIIINDPKTIYLFESE